MTSDNKDFYALWAKAMSALARREHSTHELQEKLRKHASTPLVDKLILALLQDDLISDERYAHMLCRSRFNQGIGPVRIEYELNQHQIRGNWINNALENYTEQWVDKLKELKARKYGDTNAPDFPKWAKQARFFQQRGFTTDQILQAIPH